MSISELELELLPADLSTVPLERLEHYIGGLSTPSKMPCKAFNLPAQECRTGSKLRSTDAGRKPKERKTVCGWCYALKGHYVYDNARKASYRRLERLELPRWVDVMAELIRRRGGEFRWLDAGDLPDVAFLERVARVAELTPEVTHWLPTREYRTVVAYVEAGGRIPPNLNIRLSAHMIGGRVPTFPRLAGLVTVSSVTRDEPPAGAHSCPAPAQGNVCGSCRACWDPAVSHVVYHLH